jgi:hypothetical protein
MQSFQDYLREMQSEQSQRAVTGPMVDKRDPYGSPELLSHYMEGQTASERSGEQLAIQKSAEKTSERQVAGQERAELYQLGGMGLVGAGYGIAHGEQLVSGAKAIGGALGIGSAAAPAAGTGAGASSLGALEASSAATGAMELGTEAAAAPAEAEAGAGIMTTLASFLPDLGALFL